MHQSVLPVNTNRRKYSPRSKNDQRKWTTVFVQIFGSKIQDFSKTFFQKSNFFTQEQLKTFFISVGVMNGPLKFLSARKILSLLDLLAKFKRLLACSCSPNFCVARKLAKQIFYFCSCSQKIAVLGMLANARKDHSSPLSVVRWKHIPGEIEKDIDQNNKISLLKLLHLLTVALKKKEQKTTTTTTTKKLKTFHLFPRFFQFWNVSRSFQGSVPTLGLSLIENLKERFESNKKEV